jgi:RNA polymerase sigma-70 factor (ECF subfamily)
VNAGSAGTGELLPWGDRRGRQHPATSPTEADRDRALLAGIAARDASALEKLYLRHAPALFGLCLRILGDRGEAEEVLEDVFFELWERSDRFDPGRSTPLAYLTTLARSRAIDRLRRQIRRISVLDIARSPAETREPATDGETPLEAAQGGERRRLVAALLEALDEEERRVLELSFFAGLSHSEIAARLEQPLGTVKTRIRRALVRLRDRLEERVRGAELP